MSEPPFSRVAPGAAPKRRLSYKFQRLRERIREAILSGELSGRLPGERDLAVRYNANAKTVNKALNDLAAEGLLIRHVGRGTFVAGQEPVVGRIGRPQRFCWLAAAPDDGAGLDGLFERARSVAAARGHELFAEAADLDATGQVPEQRWSPADLRRIDGIIFVAVRPSEGLLANLLRRQIPVVLINVRGITIKTNAVCADFATGAFVLTDHLCQLGHRRTALLLNGERGWLDDEALRGYDAALRRRGLEAASSRHLRGGTPADRVADAVGLLAKVVESDGATAVVSVGSDVTRVVAEALDRRGGAVPGRVGLVALVEPGDEAP